MYLLSMILGLCGAAIGAPVSDNIVVGGGTAGLTVATRLSQNLPDFSVLVVEAGPDGRDEPDIYIPGRRSSTFNSRYDWNFTSTPQPYANDREWAQNRGHVLGGSSAINLLGYDRAAKADFDAFQEMGNPGWNWSTMHSAMEAVEHFQQTPAEGSAGLRGVGEDGPINFLVNRHLPPQNEAYFPAMENLGLNQSLGFLDGDMLGYTHHTSNILRSNYTRSYSTAFLATAPENLHWMVDTMVAKVNMDQFGCATGVTLKDGTVFSAAKEVILSAGTLQSPQLLELSGIGNATLLTAAGIDTIIDMPSVGEHLQDHVQISTNYQLNSSYTGYDELMTNSTLAAQQRALYNASEPSLYDATSVAVSFLTWEMALGNASTDLIALAELQTASTQNLIDRKKLRKLRNPTARVPQLEVLLSNGYSGSKGYPDANSSLYGESFIQLLASINHPFARGSSHINVSDPQGHPVFDPRYLSNDYDLNATAEAAKYLRKVAQTPPFNRVWVDEYEPGFDAVSTDDEWVEYVKASAGSVWHPVGTCAMLPKEEGGVVSPKLKVYGTKNLRVVDASIMPIIISGHIQTAVYGVAEMAARIITEKWC